MLKHVYIRWLLGIICLLLLVFSFYNSIFVLYLSLTILLWIAVTAWGSFDVRSGYYIKTVISKKKVDRNVVALTFDDGPTEYTEEVLDLLKRSGQKATFFCIGTCVEKNPELVQRIVSEGHLIGNHTYTHSSSIGFWSATRVSEEILKTQETIAEHTGKTPAFFRPPFGVTNPNIARACKENRMKVMGWNVRSLDTVLKTEEAILMRVVPRLKKGSIILLHDTSSKTTRVLEQLLLIMKQRQIQSVTVDELIQIKGYK